MTTELEKRLVDRVMSLCYWCTDDKQLLALRVVREIVAAVNANAELTNEQLVHLRRAAVEDIGDGEFATIETFRAALAAARVTSTKGDAPDGLRAIVQRFLDFGDPDLTAAAYENKWGHDDTLEDLRSMARAALGSAPRETPEEPK